MADATSTVDPDTPPDILFRLPYELRHQIYSYLLPRTRKIDLALPRFRAGWPIPADDHDCMDSHPSHWEVQLDSSTGLSQFVQNCTVYNIFRLSRQISTEALDVFYGENVFTLYINCEGETVLADSIVAANRLRIRKLIVVAHPGGAGVREACTPDRQLWADILPNLTMLRIVAQQPSQPPGPVGSYDIRVFEKRLADWVAWFTLYLECIAGYLAKKTRVEVDVDGREESAALISKWVGTYQEVQCSQVGYSLFERAEYPDRGELCLLPLL